MNSKAAKSFLLSLVGLSLILLNIGCQNFTNDQRKEDQFKLAGNKTACLSNVGEDFSISMKNPQNPQFAAKPFDCINSAFEMFLEYTTSKDSENYTPEEIRNFLHKYFLSDKITQLVARPITDGFLQEIFAAKSILTGKSGAFISRSEIQTLMGFVEILRDEYVQLVPILSELQTSDATVNSNLKVSSSANRIANFFKSSGADYSISQLKRLVDEIERFAGQKIVSNSETWVDLIGDFKNLFVNPEIDKIKKSDWPVFFSQLGKIADIGLYAKRNLQLSFTPKSIDSLDHIVGEASCLLIGGLNLRARPEVPFDELDTIVERLHIIGAISGINVNNLQSTYKIVLTKLFATWRNTNADSVTSIRLKDLDGVLAYYNGWSDVQKFLFTQKQGAPVSELLQLRENIPSSLSANSKKHLKLFLDIIYGSEPVMLNSNGQFIIDSIEKRSLIDVKTLSIINLVKVAMQLIHDGYVQNPMRRNLFSGLTKDEFNQFYNDIRAFGVDVGLFDERTKGVGSRMFFEADLLSYGANGNQILEIEEFTGVVVNLVATGIDLNKKVRQEIYANGCEINGLADPNGYPIMDKECTESTFLKVIVPQIQSMPLMQKYSAADLKTSSGIHKELTAAILKAGRSESTSCPMGYEQGDIQQALVVLTYIEIAFQRFDTDRDGFLSKNEVRAAYNSTFKTTIRSILTKKQRFIARMGFLYMIKNGALPDEEGRKALSIIRKGIKKYDNVDRMTLIRSFADIKSFLSPSSSDDKKPYDPKLSCVQKN